MADSALQRKRRVDPQRRPVATAQRGRQGGPRRLLRAKRPAAPAAAPDRRARKTGRRIAEELPLQRRPRLAISRTRSTRRGLRGLSSDYLVARWRSRRHPRRPGPGAYQAAQPVADAPTSEPLADYIAGLLNKRGGRRPPRLPRFAGRVTTGPTLARFARRDYRAPAARRPHATTGHRPPPGEWRSRT